MENGFSQKTWNEWSEFMGLGSLSLTAERFIMLSVLNSLSVEQTVTARLKARPNPVKWYSLTFRQSCYSESPPRNPQPKTWRKMFSFFNVLIEWLAAER